MRHAAVPMLAAATALLGAGCYALEPCTDDRDCGTGAACFAGSCIGQPDPDPGEGEGERGGPAAIEVVVVLPGLEAVGRPLSFTLPVELEAGDLVVDEVGVEDCTVGLDEMAAAAAFPVTLALTCATLHLGVMQVALVVHTATGEVDVALTLRLVPSDWHDLDRTERELITIDTASLLPDDDAPAGAPVFLAADSLPEGALQASPRLIAVDGDQQQEVAFEADGHGVWFALPSSSRVWVYFTPATGRSASVLTASPWGSFEGVWHLEDGADASSADGSDDLLGTAWPAPGMVGGAASFAGDGGLSSSIALEPGSGALSAWVKLGPVATRALQVAVGVGDAEATGAFDPEGASIYTDAEEAACAFVGAGEGAPVTQQCAGQATLADDQWHHVAWRWTGTERELIIDGDARSGTPGPPPTGYDQQQISIGAALDLANPWFGDIDEVRLSATALPASWFRVEYASVTGFVTNGGRPFVQGLRPDLMVASARPIPLDGALPPVAVVPALARGVLLTFVAARGVAASGATTGEVTLSRQASIADDGGLSLTVLSCEDEMDGAPLQVTHAEPAPLDVVIGTVAFPGGTARGFGGVGLETAPVLEPAPQVMLAAAPATEGAAWMLVAVASRAGASRCDACGRHVLGPVAGGDGLVLDVFAGEREPSAHTVAPVTGPDDDAAVVIVRVAR